jgi:hypothetical protein
MFRQCLELMKCSAIGGTNILRRIVTVSCVIDGCKQLDGQMRWIMSAVFVLWTAILRDGLLRWTMSSIPSRLIDGHVGRWTNAMNFVCDLGCYHSGAALTKFANRICSHIANQICEPDLWPWKVPVLECYHSGAAPTGFANWICSHIADRICEPICGPGRFQYWSATTAGQHPPGLRTGFAATLRTGFANRSVALEGSSIGVLPQRGSTHRSCALDFQPHC